MFGDKSPAVALDPCVSALLLVGLAGFEDCTPKRPTDQYTPGIMRKLRRPGPVITFALDGRLGKKSPHPSPVGTVLHY